MRYRTLLHTLRHMMALSIMALLVGCFGIPRNLSLENEYTFPDPDGYGIVFFSASNPTNNGDWLYLYISHENKEIDRDGLQDIHPLEIAKRRSADYFGPPYFLPRQDTESDLIKAIKLPAGNYRIWNWRMRELNRTVSPVGFSEMYVFTVTKDRATYIGNLQFNLDEKSNRYAVNISDQHTNDERRFLITYPRLKQSEIISGIAKRVPLKGN